MSRKTRQARTSVSLSSGERAGVRASLAAAPLRPISPGTPAALPPGLSTSLAKILRPQAAYRWLLPQLAAITPQYIEMVLRGAMAGNHVQAWELFDLMEDSSPRLMKNLNEVKRAVVAMDWPLAVYQDEDSPPTPEAKAKMKLVSAALRTMRPQADADENAFSGMVYDILDAWAKGQSVQEVDWEVRPINGFPRPVICPRSSYWVHPTCVSWSMDGRLGLRLELFPTSNNPSIHQSNNPYTLTPGVWQTTSSQPMPSGVATFPPDKFLISICKAKSGTALGGALLRPLAWWWCCANFSADWLLNLAQVFGLPFRWANYDPTAPQHTVDAICNMLQNLGSNGWAAFPAGVDMKFLEAGKAGGANPSGDLLDRAEKQMDLLILGQTLTSDTGGSGQGGGSLALGQVHAGVKGEIIQAAGNFAAGVINSQLIPSILRLNFGDADEAPEFKPVPKKPEDAMANAQRDQILLAAGMAMPRGWVYKRHGIPVPAAGEETIGGAPPPPNPNLNPNLNPPAQPDKGPPDKLAASNPGGRGEGGPASEKLAQAGKRLLLEAIQIDFAHINARLAAAAEITDPEKQKAALAAALADLDKLKAGLDEHSAVAQAVYKTLIPAFANGLAEKPESRKQKAESGPLSAADFSEDLHPLEFANETAESTAPIHQPIKP